MLQYVKDTPWVQQAVLLLKESVAEEVLMTEKDEKELNDSLYRWIGTYGVNEVSYINTSPKLEFLVKGEDVKWQLKVNEKLSTPPNFRTIIELKNSTVEIRGMTGLMGMFAVVRFERGDIITVQKVDEICQLRTVTPVETSRKSLYFGGGWAMHAENTVGKSNNAVPNDEGIVRATKRIFPGQEIFIDYNREKKRHPVEYLDAIIEMEGGQKGKVTGFAADNECKISYTVNSLEGGGEAIKLSEQELVIQLKEKDNRKRQRNEEDEDWTKKSKKRKN
jgi:hypothetical protein